MLSLPTAASKMLQVQECRNEENHHQWDTITELKKRN
jgi:hypothetical protein